MPRWARSIRPDQTFTPACSELPCGASRRVAAGQHHRSRLHPMPRRFEDHARAHRSSPRTSRGFDSSHPEFAALRAGFSDPGTIKFNHQVHLKEGSARTERPGAVEVRGLPPGASSIARQSLHAAGQLREALRRLPPAAVRPALQRIGPAQRTARWFTISCLAKLTAYIAAHPAEIPLVDEPDKRLPTRPPQPPARNAARMGGRSAWRTRSCCCGANPARNATDELSERF